LPPSAAAPSARKTRSPRQKRFRDYVVRSVVVDSGFLIGLFDESDALHVRCRTFLRDYRGRFLTTRP